MNKSINVSRMLHHLLVTDRQVQRAFPPVALHAIEQAIQQGEARHGGQIRFALEGALHSSALFRQQSPRARALEVFSQLRIWDTEHNNGVLIYLLLADRDVEIIADRGMSSRVAPQVWEDMCRKMETAFAEGRYQAGVLEGIDAVGKCLAQYFPRGEAGCDELPNRPVVL